MNNFKNFVLPKVFMIGATEINLPGLIDYLVYTKQEDFMQDVYDAQDSGLSSGEILCSFYAKLCYKSLTNTKNKNISKTRSIENNLLNIIETMHGSVIEHCSIKFVVTDCSRVFTHEQVRHRVGTAYSQTSGRYVRGDELNIVVDPILEPVYGRVELVRSYLEQQYKIMEDQMFEGVTDMNQKKAITSALRRVLPNGQANEIGETINLRTLRQTIEARTSRFAEWEIRVIYNQIFDLVQNKYPTMFFDATSELVKDLREITFKYKKI